MNRPYQAQQEFFNNSTCDNVSRYLECGASPAIWHHKRTHDSAFVWIFTRSFFLRVFSVFPRHPAFRHFQLGHLHFREQRARRALKAVTFCGSTITLAFPYFDFRLLGYFLGGWKFLSNFVKYIFYYFSKSWCAIWRWLEFK